ncbi:BBA14 family lipoprotein [Borreliella valaisiana]|uniref:BBA14 family lipoprotein n=1 Tax=Borreliella valaisiana TaxID=62088 RepID=UPI00041F8329|nr:BBA14 family lipoprotein [Borreliella valaisiana]
MKKLTKSNLLLYIVGFIFLMLLSCESIPSLPKKPSLSDKNDNKNLVLNEAKLFEYATSLRTWLLYVKKYVKKHYVNHKFPPFENFDASYGQENGTEDTGMLKERIEYYKRYISKTEPIVFELYKKYSRR